MENSREPDELTLVQSIVDSMLAELHTCLPARVVKFTPGSETSVPRVDVQPVLQRVYLDEDEAEVVTDYPVITNVPVTYPRGGGFELTWPLRKDDPVWLVFCQRSTDSYLETDGKTLLDPQDARKHDLTDAVCIPGGGTFKAGMKTAHAEDLVIGFEDGSIELHVQPDGEVWWKVPAGKEFHFGGQAASKALALAEVCNARLDKLEGWAGEHVHLGNSVPGVTLPLFVPWAIYGLPSAGQDTSSERMFTDA